MRPFLIIAKLSDVHVQGENSDGESSDNDSSSSVISEEDDEEMLEVMEQLSNELATFSNLKSGDTMGVAEQEPVDIDYNLVANLLESYSGQVGGAGPTSNIMHTLGIDVPKID